MINRPTRPQNGFTLLEMVIVLGIIGTLLGTFLSFYQPTVIARKQAETDLKIQRVLNAVSSFAMRNNRLPCPASPTEDPAGGSFGQSTGTSCSGTGVGGLVPYRTLGLMQEDAQDGFDHYFTYIVHGPATVSRGSGADILISTTPNEPLGSFFCNVNSGMTIKRTTNLTTVDEANNAVVAVISHGAEGVGGYNMSLANRSDRSNPIAAASLNNVTGTRERENAVDRNFNETDIADYTPGVDPINRHFDDQVGYMTSAGVVTRLGVTICHVRLF